MKIIILYGVGEVGKRNELLKLKKNFGADAISQIDFKIAGLSGIEMAIASKSLFVTDPRLLVVENVTEKLDLKELKTSDPDLTLLLMVGNLPATSTLLHSAKEVKARTIEFQGEQEITAFPFLDQLIEKKKGAFLELEKLLSEYGGMYVLTMIYYVLRRNLLPLPASAFMQKKIIQQKQNFTLKDWQDLYYLTLKTEFNIKSGLISEKSGLVFLTETIFLKGSGK